MPGTVARPTHQWRHLPCSRTGHATVDQGAARRSGPDPLHPPLSRGTPHTTRPLSTGCPKSSPPSRHYKAHRSSLSHPFFPPILSFTGRVSTPPLYPSSSCPHWATGAPLPPSEFEPLSSFLPLFGELTPPATIVLIVYLLSPLRGPLKLQEPFAAATDHRSTATVVTS
jgi:hypothetical protein